MHGVISAVVGYAGGTTPDPTYTHMGDHSETVRIAYDPDVISYDRLLAEFWAGNDPVKPPLKRQYASVIFYESAAQRAAAQTSLREQEAERGKLYTEIMPLRRFYRAEEYHQDYYAKRGSVPGICSW